jgi:hypothetical protein
MGIVDFHNCLLEGYAGTVRRLDARRYERVLIAFDGWFSAKTFLNAKVAKKKRKFAKKTWAEILKLHHYPMATGLGAAAPNRYGRAPPVKSMKGPPPRADRFSLRS